MKQTIQKAVRMIAFIFCAAFGVASCNSYDLTEEDHESSLVEKECVVASNVFNADGAVAITRATVDYNRPDGTLSVVSNHVKKFLYDFAPIERKYQGFFNTKVFNVHRPRYAKKIDIFRNPSWSERVIGKDSLLQTVTFPDGQTHDFDIAILETSYYDTDTVVVAGRTFKKCKNEWMSRQLLDKETEIIDLQRDSTDWHAWKVILHFRYELAEGPQDNKVVIWKVTIPLIWAAKDGTDPDIPEGDSEIVNYKDGDSGIEAINDSTARSWLILIPTLSNGKDGEPFTVEAFLKFKLIAPEYQIKSVVNFDWKSLTAKPSDAVKNGEQRSQGDTIFVQPYMQVFTTYTNLCDAIFTGEYDGAPYYRDKFGKAHVMKDAKWSFKDDGWKDSSLDPKDGLNRLLLTSNITGTYLTKKPSAKGEVELRTGGEGGKKVVKFEYTNFGIKTVKPMLEYWSYATQTAVYSDGKTADLGEVGVTLYMSVDSPDDQTIQVFDWNIADTNPQLYDPAKEGEPRPEKVATGTFKVQKYSRVYATNTNKSEHKFTSHAETSVIFTDSLGKETQFKGIELTYADNGSTKTLEQLPEQDDKERKSMKPSIKVTAIGTDSNDYSGSVLLWKQKDKEPEEELESWDHTESLSYAGSGLWTSTSTITYKWKIAGTKSETITQSLEWSISGEQKKQVFLDEAKADYQAPIGEGTWSGETSSTPQNFVTLYTKTNSSISENYTTLTDKYTAKQQRAVIKKTVDGKDITINMLAPTEMTVAHGSGSLVNGSKTTEKGGKTYDVWDHTGSVTATVTSNSGNQTETATVLKEVLVETKPVEPYNPAWGNVVGLINATLTYRPYVGSSSQGAFHKTLAIRFENGILIVTTASYGREGNWNPFDFTFDSDDFYYFEGKQPASARAKTRSAASGNYYSVPKQVNVNDIPEWHAPYVANVPDQEALTMEILRAPWQRAQTRAASTTIPENANINSAALFDNRWKPALLWPDGTGWKYIVDATHYVNMSKQLAETCGIKNFSGKATADVTPYLNYTGTVSADKVLTVKSETGAPVFVIK